MWDTTPIVSLFAGMTRLESYPTSKNRSLSASHFHDAERRPTMEIDPVVNFGLDRASPPGYGPAHVDGSAKGFARLWIEQGRTEAGHSNSRKRRTENGIQGLA